MSNLKTVSATITSACIMQGRISEDQEIDWNADYRSTYNIDDLDLVEITMFVEKELKTDLLNDELVKRLSTFGQIRNYVQRTMDLPKRTT